MPSYCQNSGNIKAKTGTMLMATINTVTIKKSERNSFSAIVTSNTDTVISSSITQNSVLIITVKSGAAIVLKKDSTIALSITVNHSKNNSKDSLILDTVKFNSTITITTKKDSGIYVLTAKNVSLKGQTDTGRFSFLNAYNFDFSSKLTSNYVGHVNVMKVYELTHPGFIKALGFNAGIMKISYSGGNLDSTSNSFNNYVHENVLIHPLDSIKTGTKYLQEYNKYTQSKQNTVWSFYAQFLMKVNSDPDNQIFLHIHTELLVNDWTATTKITNVQQDTAVINSTKNFYARPDIGSTIVYKTTLLNGYFGAGATFDLKISDKSRIFIQPTVGITTSKPNFASTDINSNVIFVKSDGVGAFYLGRVNYENTVTKSLTIVLGTDIRGLFPTYPPMYAAYVGAKLDISAISKLINP